MHGTQSLSRLAKLTEIRLAKHNNSPHQSRDFAECALRATRAYDYVYSVAASSVERFHAPMNPAVRLNRDVLPWPCSSPGLRISNKRSAQDRSGLPPEVETGRNHLKSREYIVIVGKIVYLLMLRSVKFKRFSISRDNKLLLMREIVNLLAAKLNVI